MDISSLDSSQLEAVWAASAAERKRAANIKRYFDGEWEIPLLQTPRRDGRERTVCKTNWVSIIAQTHSGFVCNKDVQYTLEDLEADTGALQDYYRWMKRAETNQNDAEAYSTALLYGWAAELFTQREEGPVGVVSSPLEWSLLRDEFGEVQTAFRRVRLERGSLYRGELLSEDVELMTAYDAEQVVRWEKRKGKGKDGKSAFRLVESQPHYFGRLPIVFYYLNKDWAPFFRDSLLCQIDKYAVVQSALTDDIHLNTNALMVTKGVNWEDLLQRDKAGVTVIAKMRQEGMINLREGEDVNYITKPVETSKFMEDLASTRSSIHLEAHIPDLQESVRTNPNLSGIALKIMYSSLEQSSANHVKYFENGLKDRVRLWNQVRALFSEQPLEDFDVKVQFSIPQNDVEWLNGIGNMRTVLSHKETLSQLPFIENPERVLREWELEQEAIATEAATPAAEETVLE